MSQFADLKTTINDSIRTNGRMEITGAVLNSVLNAMVDSLGANSQFKGVATPETVPGTPDQNVAYIASVPGDYDNFIPDFTLAAGQLAVFLYNGSWTVQTLSVGKDYDATIQTITQNVAALLSFKTRISRDLGYNATQKTITLTAGETGKYVKCGTRSAVANANFNISAPFNVDACDELLIKTGYNPSDNAHAALDISVISIYEEIERTRTVQEKDSSNNPLYWVVEVDPETGQEIITDQKTTVDTGYPCYVQETYTEHRYLPNNEDRFVAIPDSGYYVANIPQSCKCVVSYKPGVSELEVIVVKHGALANLTSQIFGIYEHRTMAEAVVSLAYRVLALEESKARLGNATAGKLDAREYTKDLYPTILYGHGVPSAEVRPENLPAGLPWDGVPVFIGQQYINLDAASAGLYYAKGVNAVSDWVNA